MLSGLESLSREDLLALQQRQIEDLKSTTAIQVGLDITR